MYFTQSRGKWHAIVWKLLHLTFKMAEKIAVNVLNENVCSSTRNSFNLFCLHRTFVIYKIMLYITALRFWSPDRFHMDSTHDQSSQYSRTKPMHNVELPFYYVFGGAGLSKKLSPTLQHLNSAASHLNSFMFRCLSGCIRPFFIRSIPICYAYIYFIKFVSLICLHLFLYFQFFTRHFGYILTLVIQPNVITSFLIFALNISQDCLLAFWN